MASYDIEEYVDFSYRGLQVSQSEDNKYPFVLTGMDAIKNVIKMYLFSYRGDYGRNLSRGGPLVEIIGKSLDLNYEEKIKELIRTALGSYTNIIINSVSVVKDVELKIWKISIIFSDTYNKVTDSINTSMKE